MQIVHLTRMQAFDSLIAYVNSFRFFRDRYGQINQLYSHALLIGAGWLLLNVVIDSVWGPQASNNIPVLAFAAALELMYMAVIDYSNNRKPYYVPDPVFDEHGKRINPASGLPMCGALPSDIDTANNRFGFDVKRRVYLSTTFALSDLYQKAPVNPATGLAMVVDVYGAPLGYDLAGSKFGERNISPGFNLHSVFQQGPIYRPGFNGRTNVDASSSGYDVSAPSGIDSSDSAFEPKYLNPATGLPTLGNVCGGIDVAGNQWCHNDAFEPHWTNPATGLDTVGNVCGGIDVGGNQWCHNDAFKHSSSSYDCGSSHDYSCSSNDSYSRCSSSSFGD
jgi:hypothetical protein